MPLATINLPLTRDKFRLLSMLWTDRKSNEPLYFTVDNGELLVSTEPLGDDPSERVVINPEPLHVAKDRESASVSAFAGWAASRSREDRLRVWLALGGSEAEFLAFDTP